MLIKGRDIANIKPVTLSPMMATRTGNSITCCPIRLLAWVEKGHPQRNTKPEFSTGGSAPACRAFRWFLLFLLHLISRCARRRRQPLRHCPERFAAVHWRAGSGESEIRRYVLENDLVGRPLSACHGYVYNTGISTYVWILSNRKSEHRKGLVQLIDASGFWQKMRKAWVPSG